MKKVFTLLSLAGVLFAGSKATAQSIAVAHDTIAFSNSALQEVHNDVTNTSGSSLTVIWRVVASNFPTDWINNMGICDNVTCISSSGLWPSGTAYEFSPIAASGNGSFKMQIDLSGAGIPNGTYFMRVRFNNKFGAVGDTATETFIVTRAATSVQTIKTTGDIALYPNPATSNVNVVFDAATEVKNIAIYNIIGKQMVSYKVGSANSASLNIENMPSGIYFARLLNSSGDVIATRKFTKQ